MVPVKVHFKEVTSIVDYYLYIYIYLYVSPTNRRSEPKIFLTVGLLLFFQENKRLIRVCPSFGRGLAYSGSLTFQPYV